MHVEFAQNDRTGFLEPSHNLGIFNRVSDPQERRSPQ